MLHTSLGRAAYIFGYKVRINAANWESSLPLACVAAFRTFAARGSERLGRSDEHAFCHRL
jgi:hypothetical protein